MKGESDLVRLIVGLPRAGTTALSRALSEDARVCAFGETLYWGRRWVEPVGASYSKDQIVKISNRIRKTKLGSSEKDNRLNDAGESLAMIASSNFLKVAVRQTPGRAFSSMCQAIAESRHCKFYVEKTPHHLMHLDRIFEHVGPVRVVVCLRRPDEFVLSYKYQGHRRRDSARSSVMGRYHPIVVALLWRAGHLASSSALSKYKSDIFLVYLDELIKKPERWLRDIRGHLCLPEFDQTAFGKDNSSFPEDLELDPVLTSAEQSAIYYICRTSARGLGISLRRPKFAPLLFFLLALTLPLWWLKNYRSLSSADNGGIKGLLQRWLVWR